ncbi:ankyrin repeat domain-containing protein 13C-B-like [Cynara cardunculus var. scolymus]|uniref:Ankyrin repeat-containing protein n=1 Tax=Cynara cardunculus var. scolymus TaxID=59895 RepID=A0A103Y0I9_CYNCS|nr:ankyrin repeat domain-containing protein 13C-B-like [Cynara cardunculus var. scolymus]KVI00294.1 Ankyrin repeat-containing protein [Cynara cardunculus var. scolymus]
MAAIDVAPYSHSPAHKAVLTKDYSNLRKIISGLPRLCDPSEIRTESDSIAEEAKADAISAVIDRRDVPNRDTPLHLAVKFSDIAATEMLMVAGADWSLQNEDGWSALQEAICNREEPIAKVIIRHYQPTAWAKWCRRLPRLLATMRRMRDFYMEMTFQFESSVIPFISRIAPSDTYKIWKRGANLRADMTLAGFDGFRIQRANQTVLFLGDGSEDGKVPPGSLCMISHKDKEVMNALDGAGGLATDEEVQQEVRAMSQTNIFRPGIDVTQAVLLPQMTWRRHEKTELVGVWRSKVYDMHNVVVSIKSRRVPGARSDEELFASRNENETDSEELNDVLTDEERKQLEAALKFGSPDLNNENENGVIDHRHSCCDRRDIPIADGFNHENGDNKQEKGKKGWFDGWRKRETKNDDSRKGARSPSTSHSQSQSVPGRHSIEIVAKGDENRNVKASKPSSSTSSIKRKDGVRESEYKKGLRPILWLSPDFPLQTNEFLPLLDLLANKVKAIRRLRELLTTKLPMGTFPVKVAIPVIPTIRVLVTFTKFEELQPLDEFSTPLSSPTDGDRNIPATGSSSSWFQWIKAPYQQASSSSSALEQVEDPFVIPADYSWITAEAKKKKMQEKSKSNK